MQKRRLSLCLLPQAEGQELQSPQSPQEASTGSPVCANLLSLCFYYQPQKNTRNLPQKMILLKITSLTASPKVAVSFDIGTLCANISTSFSLCSDAISPPSLCLENLVFTNKSAKESSFKNIARIANAVPVTLYSMVTM